MGQIHHWQLRTWRNERGHQDAIWHVSLESRTSKSDVLHRNLGSEPRMVRRRTHVFDGWQVGSQLRTQQETGVVGMGEIASRHLYVERRPSHCIMDGSAIR